MYQSQHWASDVVMGAGIGTFTGLKIVRYAHAHPDNWIDKIMIHTPCRADAGRRRRDAWLVVAVLTTDNMPIKKKSHTRKAAAPTKRITREHLIELLNEDLSREYQAIIAYVVYSQVMKGAQFMSIAGELEKHAGEELEHAITIAKQIDYLGGSRRQSRRRR